MNKKIRLLCLGDSLTEGYNIDKKDAWVTLLGDVDNITAVNAGISGDTTAGMLARLPLLLNQNKYTHVFIMGGTNDIEFDMPNNQVVLNIKAIVRQLQYQDIELLVGIPMPYYYQLTPNESFQFLESSLSYAEKLDEYCEMLKKYAIKDGINFIDFREIFTDEKREGIKELYLDDGVHPSVEGHLAIYRHLNKFIAKVWKT